MILNLLKVFIFFLCVWFIWNKWHSNYLTETKPPFWEGTEILQVCVTPYFSSNECYKLKVSLDDESSATIFFNNGGYIEVEEMECYFAAKMDSTPRYVFCRSWTAKDGKQIDLMPTWVNY